MSLLKIWINCLNMLVLSAGCSEAGAAIMFILNRAVPCSRSRFQGEIRFKDLLIKQALVFIAEYGDLEK